MRNAYKVALIIVMIMAVIIVFFHTSFAGSRKTKVKISTTTSLYASGLLEFLAREFKKLYPDVDIVFIAVGSGAALEYAKRGDVCAVFVHAPNLEKKYIELKAIRNHRVFAYNNFLVVGPSNDPANISRATSIQQAFKQIYSTARNGRALFVSRGDRSGTHIREISIWRSIGIAVGDDWYKECGCSADQVLIIANELKAYTLADFVTYAIFKARGRIQHIEALYANYSDPLTINVYSMYISSSCGSANEEKYYAELFLDFVYQNQHLIEEFNKALGFSGFYPAKYSEEFLYKVWNELVEVDAGG